MQKFLDAFMVGVAALTMIALASVGKYDDTAWAFIALVAHTRLYFSN